MSPASDSGKLGARVSPAPRSRHACHFLSAGLAGLEDEGERTSTAGLLRHLGLLSAGTRQRHRSASSQRRGQMLRRSRRTRQKDGPALAGTPPGRVRGEGAAVSGCGCARRCQTVRLRSGGAGREEGRRRQRRRLLRRRRRGSGGRCFCQFRLFVREVDPPLPEQPGGSCGTRGQYRPRPPARTAPARHGPGLRPPLQAAHHRRQRCGQEQFTVAFCRQHFLRQLHHHDWSGFQDPDRGDKRGEGEAADLGHGGAGALPHHHLHVLSGDPRGHCSLRCHQCRVLCQCQAVASRNQPEL
ncbi:ras-related protein Rab-35 isoform X1 [Saimiri boliviensis]|uniref:ras-related protein Rab-35 isoform X1 n=1 Tax=Saimiri boliviensis TaxID=27679 RepID=UPI003D78068C